jgi:hypothetical protein
MNEPVRSPLDLAAGAAQPLPTWNLDDLYPGRDSEALRRDLEVA